MFIKVDGIILNKKQIKAAYVNSATYQLIIERDGEVVKFYHDTKEAAYQKLNELWDLLK